MKAQDDHTALHPDSGCYFMFGPMKTLGDLNVVVNDFAKAASLAGVSLSSDAISYESLPAPHKPPSTLPEGKMAVYVFVWNGVCLKVGKVGPKSHARFTSQHYIPGSSNSNLAKSLVAAGGKNGIPVLSEAKVGEWIKTNVGRVNFLVSAKCGVPVLTLLESFLQCRLKPIFEGVESQR